MTRSTNHIFMRFVEAIDGPFKGHAYRVLRSGK